MPSQPSHTCDAAMGYQNGRCSDALGHFTSVNPAQLHVRGKTHVTVCLTCQLFKHKAAEGVPPANNASHSFCSSRGRT